MVGLSELARQEIRQHKISYWGVNVLSTFSNGLSSGLLDFPSQIRKYTEEIGSHDGRELVDAYAGGAVSGTKMDKRKHFNRMLSDCRKGRIDKILVKSVSRFARNTKDCLVSLRELATLGVSVYFEKENIHSETLTTELMVSVSGALAQQESVSTSQNQRISYLRRMERGEFITTKAPFGYRLKDGKNLEVVEDEARLIRKVFSLYLSGVSTPEIVKVLSETGVPTRDGRAAWNHVGVNYILRNEKYIGDALCQKTLATDRFPFVKKRNEGEKDQYYVERTHPAIISKEAFELVHGLLEFRSQDLSGPYKCYPLTKKVVCGHCGSTFVRKASASGYVSWSCLKHTRDSADCPVGQIDMILTKSLSRSAWNTVDCLAAVRMLRGRGIGVHFEKENINTLTETGKFTITLFSGFAQEESESMGKNIDLGNKAAMLEGKISFHYD